MRLSWSVRIALLTAGLTTRPATACYAPVLWTTDSSINKHRDVFAWKILQNAGSQSVAYA